MKRSHDLNLSVSEEARPYWLARESVTGAFWNTDFLVFDRLLKYQSEVGIGGDLLEIGTLYGKSAIVLGCHAGPDEQVIISDLFEDEGAAADNALENADSYKGLTRQKFEANYSRFIDKPARVIQGLSQSLVGQITDSSVRFAHIDGGHLHEVVRTDLANVQQWLTDDGIVVLDDFRAIHTPGVAAAAWEAVANGLIPICTTEQKLYASWSEVQARQARTSLLAWLQSSESPAIHCGLQTMHGRDMLILTNPQVLASRREKLVGFIPPRLKSRLVPFEPHLGRRI